MRRAGTFAPRGPLALLLALAVLAATDATPALGAAFTVDATHDAVDASPGDGICADAAGACTLRAAVMETNALPGPDLIYLPAGSYELSIPGAGEDAGATGDLDIGGDLAIIAAVSFDDQGLPSALVTIQASNGDRVFEVRPSATGYILGVVITGGSVSGITDVVGGGIANRGSLLTLETVRLAGNSASAGGGLWNKSGSTLDVFHSTIAENRAAFGAGLLNEGDLIVESTTVSGNSATLFGAGLANAGSDTIPGPFGNAVLMNSTVSGNSGDGIVTAGSLSLTNVTIADNSGVGLAAGSFGGENVTNTMVVNNSVADCQVAPGITSLGHNLDSDGTCGLNGPGDLSGIEPLLGPLGDNGGPTQTHALLAGSPAIDGGDNAACPATDQRGRSRPFDGDGDGVGECDIGAYEMQEPPLTCADPCGPVPATPTPTAPVATPTLPIALPPTGGNAGSASALTILAVVIALPVAILAAAFGRRALLRYLR